jgi:hypothetical protein
MLKNLSLILIGFLLGTFISTAWAKYESGTNDAISIVGYGKNGNTLVPLKVDSTGALQTQ